MGKTNGNGPNEAGGEVVVFWEIDSQGIFGDVVGVGVDCYVSILEIVSRLLDVLIVDFSCCFWFF
jgi:hypothetical protein